MYHLHFCCHLLPAGEDFLVSSGVPLRKIYLVLFWHCFMYLILLYVYFNFNCLNNVFILFLFVSCLGGSIESSKVDYTYCKIHYELGIIRGGEGISFSPPPQYLPSLSWKTPYLFLFPSSFLSFSLSNQRSFICSCPQLCLLLSTWQPFPTKTKALFFI